MRLFLAVALMLIGCASSAPDEPRPTAPQQLGSVTDDVPKEGLSTVPFRVVQQAFYESRVRISGEEFFVPPAFVALRTKSEEIAFVESYPTTGDYYRVESELQRLGLSEVDYSSETVAIIALGASHPLIGMRIDSVKSSDSHAIVYSTKTERVECLSSRQAYNPAIIIAIEDSGREVLFAPMSDEHVACE